MQLSGSFLQSVLHLNLSHANHPIGGVKANPLSNPDIFPNRHSTNTVQKQDFQDAIINRCCNGNFLMLSL